jgi:hypothetical protein
MYTIQYFIDKFEAIPKEKWITGYLHLSDRDQHCMLGHCGVNSLDTYDESNLEANALEAIFRNSPEGKVYVDRGYFAWEINDRHLGIYSNPKQAVLAWLRKEKERLDALNQGA